MLVLMAGSVARGLCVSALFLNFLLLVGRTGPVWAASEPGKWTVDVSSQALENNQQFLVFKKTLFNSSAIHLKVLSHSCPNVPVLLDISWYLRNSHCYNEIFSLEQEQAKVYFGSDTILEKGGSGLYVLHHYSAVDCQSLNLNFFSLDLSEVKKTPMKLLQPQNTTGRRRRDAIQPMPVAASGATNQSSSRSTFSLVAESWEDGPYVFILRVQDLSRNKDSKDPWTLQLQVSMEGPHGYISATEWPLMMFYMVMCIVYVLMAVLWLVLSACFWRDLLRIQFWIGGVIFLGMLEKAVYYAEFQSIRYDGLSVHGAVLFAEVLSAVKRTLARVLVIIASLGYGIVKPRLGALMHRVVAVGLLYLVFSIVEGILRVNMDRGNTNNNLFLCDVVLAFIDSCVVWWAEDDVLLAAIPLALLDSTLCWWIFVSLAQTMKLLKLRRNVVKLSLFRHFTNTLIFAVIASVVFIIWTTKTFTMSECRSDWREVWIQDAFWRFLFSLILLVIMFLWRPSANNQRYAFSPLVDEESDDEEREPMVNEAFEGMKMRGTKNEPNGTAKANKVDEDLKWVEENIPSSMADVALPPLLDSDEETQTTKFEMSKME